MRLPSSTDRPPLTAAELLMRLRGAGCQVEVKGPRRVARGTVPDGLQRPILVCATGIKALIIKPGVCGG